MSDTRAAAAPPSPPLVVRRLLVDLRTPLPRQWNGGDAWRTALFNALSMRFPVGRLKRFHVRAWLGVTAAAEPRLQALWLWHASKEAERRSTAFGLYRALVGNGRRRLRLFNGVTRHVCTDLLRQTVHNLWHGGTWRQPRTWAQGGRFLFGRNGLAPSLWAPWRGDRRADFQPAQRDNPEAVQWLAQNTGAFPPVQQPTI